MGFNKLIGNEKVKQNLIKILNNNTIAHSYMFIRYKRNWKKRICKGICKRNIMFKSRQ